MEIRPNTYWMTAEEGTIIAHILGIADIKHYPICGTVPYLRGHQYWAKDGRYNLKRTHGVGLDLMYQVPDLAAYFMRTYDA